MSVHVVWYRPAFTREILPLSSAYQCWYLPIKLQDTAFQKTAIPVVGMVLGDG